MTLDDITKSAASALFGFLAAVVAFRTRFTVIEMRLQQVEKDREDDKKVLKSIERQQRVTLELIAAIARKSNVTHRALTSDALAEALSEE